ncbi:sulfotransferase family protein [Kitasatospora sp. NPDC049258]|uniref:sulfotransferase-like domain-containing protein n=1 Tax=Kitasatospora sp. NPDC049258 TaxID=3155394 RepID=UPI003446722C
MNPSAPRPRVIALWGPPRSRSTAFTRMMMERRDLLVLHEPISNLLSVGHLDLDGVRVHSPAELLERILLLGEDRPVFFKDTTEYRYLPYLDERFTTGIVHTFIIRDPAEAIASHFAVNPDLTLEEVGYERQFEVFEHVRRATGSTPVVIDSTDLLADPAGVVRAYCERAGLPFRPEALSWEPGPRAEWERTARWHQDVAASGSFGARTNEYRRTVHNDPRLAGFRDHHQPFHDRLAAVRIGSTARSVTS